MQRSLGGITITMEVLLRMFELYPAQRRCRVSSDDRRRSLRVQCAMVHWHEAQFALCMNMDCAVFKLATCHEAPSLDIVELPLSLCGPFRVRLQVRQQLRPGAFRQTVGGWEL